MSIQFYCPDCGAIVAFKDHHKNKRARCLTCGQLFIIPEKDFDKAKKITPEPERPSEPIPGFYKAVFIDNWKLFFDMENATTLVFIIAIICFKFFLAPGACCFGLISHFVVWGWLFGFYLNVIYETAYEIDKLPKIYLGTSMTFAWNILKPIGIFFYTMFLCHIPFIIGLAVLQRHGIGYENMWHGHTAGHLVLQVLFILGISLFPISVLTTAVGRDITLLIPNYTIPPIFKAFIPYVVISVLLVATAVLEVNTRQMDYDLEMKYNAVRLLGNLGVQFAAIFAMRSIGLFYRHYSCCFKW